MVQFVLTHDFVLAGADTRSSDMRLGIISNNFNKLIRSDKGVIIGCAGNAQDCHALLADYATYSADAGLQIYRHDDYAETVMNLAKRFERLKSFPDQTYDLTVVVCGYNGEDFTGIIYCLSPDPEGKLPGISIVSVSETGYTHFMIGSERLDYHMRNFDKLFAEESQNGPVGVRQYKDIMRQVLGRGVLYDQTINMTPVYKLLKRN